MNKERAIGTVTITDKNQIDLFRIHLYESSIRFDPKFSDGINKNDKLSNEVFKVSEKWGKGDLSPQEVFIYILEAFEPYQEHLQNYYFGTEDLNGYGKYVDIQKIDSLSFDIDERFQDYYLYLLNNDVLKSIQEQEFTSNMKNKEITDIFLDNYAPKGAAYFKYPLRGNDSGMFCRIMVKNKKLLMGYVS